MINSKCSQTGPTWIGIRVTVFTNSAPSIIRHVAKFTAIITYFNTANCNRKKHQVLKSNQISKSSLYRVWVKEMWLASLWSYINTLSNGSSKPELRLCKGVLGRGENGVKYIREQGEWGQKDPGAGSKEKFLRQQGSGSRVFWAFHKTVPPNRASFREHANLIWGAVIKKIWGAGSRVLNFEGRVGPPLQSLRTDLCPMYFWLFLESMLKLGEWLFLG